MLFGYLATSLFIGLFMSFIWSSNGFKNCVIKTAFSAWTLWTAVMILGALWPMIQNGAMRLI